MWNRKNRIRRNTRRHQVSRKIIPLVESFEPRLLMSADGFLQGTVFVDSNLNNQYEPANGDTPLAGALVQLFNQSNTLVASTTSAADGSYLLTGLTPGTYNLVETPPSGYANEGTQVNSPLDPVSATTSNSVTVQVEDLSSLSVTYNAPYEFSTLEPGTIELDASPNGGVSYDSVACSIGQMPVTVTYPGGTTAQFSSDCVDVFSQLTYGVDTETASGEPLSTTLVPATNAGAIGYLYDQYGYMLSAQPASLSEAYNLQALQLAIWKLIYDTGTNLTTFSSGNIEDPSIETAYDGYESVENDSLSDLESRALGYISQGLNYSEQAIELYATSGSNGYQNLLAPGSLNFSNVPKASPSITTTPGGAVVIGSGAGLSDTAILSSGTNPTGTVTFTLYGPDGTVVTTESDDVSGDGSYSTPTPYVPSGTGTYEWAVAYSGDSNNNGASSPASAEQETVSLATPAITTTPGGTVVIGSGAGLSDTAILSGGYDLTGTVTFTLYGPDGTVVTTESDNVSGADSYSTPTPYVPSGTGTYEWAVAYSGDSNNNGASSPASAEQETVSPASPAITTTPGGIVVIGSGAGLSDTAILSGGYDLTGTVTFTLYGPDGTVVTTESDDVSGDGSYSTPTPYVPSGTGTYEWAVAYSGDSNNNGASSPASAEQETVSPASPAITTTPGGTVVIGSGAGLSDTAILSGGYDLTGTVTFTLYGPDGTVVTTESDNVSGDGSYSTPTPYVPSSTGTYEWAVAYSGDSNNNGASSPASAEQETVSPASPAITTTPGGTVVIGSGAGLSDTAILSGGYDLTGTVTFTLYSPSGTVVKTESDNVSGDGSYSTPTAYVPTGTGTYEWAVAYSGDSNNNGASSPASAEQETVSLATPAISTTPNTSTGMCGTTETIKDTASLTGGYAPTGTITFTLYNPNGTLVDTETVNVSGDGSYSTPNGYALPTNAIAGTYQWDSTYSGNGNNNAVSENNATAEQVVVGKATPGLSTTPSTSTGTCGSTETIKDKASLTGGDNPTGTITFTLYNPNGTLVDTETVNVSGDGSYSTPNGYALPTNAIAGTYQWDSTYSGNGNNNAVSENNATAEQVVVGKATPGLSTTPSTSTGTCGSTETIKDKASLTGGDNPTGTITFTLYNPNGTLVDTETVSVSGDGSYSTPSGYALPANAIAGTYQWDSTYSGNGNNNAVSENNATAEQVVVGKAGPSISTTPNTTVVSVGTATSLNDTATLSGGDNPTGSITFTLYSPSGSKLDTATVSVNGDGSYTTPNYSLSSSASAGIYQWDATYNGDGNNNSASDNNDSAEQVWVITPCCNLENVSFTVDNSSGQKVGTYSSLGGNVQQGDTVTANFTVPNGDYDQLTIVSYIAPQSYYSQTSAYLQQVYQSSTGVFAPGSHSLTVTVPGSYFQVDFVCGTPITQLGLNPGDFYNAQSRMQSSDNGGTTIPSVLAGSNVGTGQTATPAFWTSSSGQTLIDNLNGGSSATNLGNWLGTISPNLLGKLAGETNTQVASYVKGLGTSSAVSQVVASALAAYVTDNSLAGTTAASYGFTVTAYGTGIDNDNVGSNGSALGLSNNNVYSLVTLLAAIDSESSNGSINSSANGAASTIFTAINKAGGII